MTTVITDPHEIANVLGLAGIRFMLEEAEDAPLDVWVNAPSCVPATDLETWFIRGGSAGAALYTFLQPGIYAYVNHNLIEAAELGATAHFKVSGDWNDDLMKQVAAPGPIVAE